MWWRVKHIIGMALLVIIATGCNDINLHVNYVSGPSLMLNVTCEIDSSDPDYFVGVECDAEQGASYIVRLQNTTPKTPNIDNSYILRCIVDLYRVVNSHSEFVERKTHYIDPYDRRIPVSQFNVSSEEYKVLVWCDYVRSDNPEESLYYQTDDLRQILYTDIEVKDNLKKDVFTAMANINLQDYASTLTGVFDIHEHMVLERPNGVLKCISTDVNDFLVNNKVEEITCVFSYVQYVATGYNVEEQKPNHFDIERTYLTTTSMDEVSERGELTIYYDYVFVNGRQTNVKINFSLYNGKVTLLNNTLIKEDGTLVSEADRITTWSDISVPLKKNMETVVSGRLLTTSFEPGGIGIMPGFEDEIIIPWD